MSTRRQGAQDELEAPELAAQSSAGGNTEPRLGVAGNQAGAARVLDANGAPYSASRKRRRRHRSQKGKQRRPAQVNAPHLDLVSRERMFQDIEGLLRQIRERAEDSTAWTDEQLSDFTQAVTGFTKLLEQEGEPVSQRGRGEYQRMREKLSQALKG
jgi:hypothetical protein